MRAEFLLREDMTHLNHGALGACPRVVFEAYQAHQLRLERHPTDMLMRHYNDTMRPVREAVAAFVGAQPDDLVMTTNVSMAVTILARSLDLAPGDEVLSTDHEYGAIDKSWQYVCEKAGATYVRHPIAAPILGPEDLVERVWSGVTERTKVLSLSHISAPTALIFPIEELVRRARERGIFTVIDGAHAVGQIPVNLDTIGADAYAGNCHKWLCAPKGSAFLHVRKEAQARVAPLVVSWGWRSWEPGPSKFIDEQEWTGTRDISPWLAVPDAIDYWTTRGFDTRSDECHTLAMQARARLGELTGLPPIAPESMHAQMVTVPLPQCDFRGLQTRLIDEHRVDVATNRWGGRPHLRVSIAVYNTASDLDVLIGGLKAVLGR